MTILIISKQGGNILWQTKNKIQLLKLRLLLQKVVVANKRTLLAQLKTAHQAVQNNS